MTHCVVDTTIQRLTKDGFQFPLGVYPVEDLTPVPGYMMEFEQADGDNEGEWEEWPDRYVFDIVVSAERLQALCRALFAMLPGRVFPIFDFLGHDAYREVDPYVAYELVGVDRFMDGLRRFRDFFYEDGLCGFGAISEEPFFYVFVDEHKIVTIRAEPEMKDRIERVLHAFDLHVVPEPAGADSASHEHRSILLLPPEDQRALSPEEIVERLLDEWRLTLNIDANRNVDDNDRDLGITGWRCIVRVAETEESPRRYAEVVLAAGSYAAAQDLAFEAADSMLPDGTDAWEDQILVAADRMTAAQVEQMLGKSAAAKADEEGILRAEWVE